MSNHDTQFDTAHADLERSARRIRVLSGRAVAYTPGFYGMWRRRPLVLTALSLLTGDLIGLGCGIELQMWCTLACVSLAFAIVMALMRRPRAWQLLICVLMLGGVMGSAVMTSPAVPLDGEHYITGRVVSLTRNDDERLTIDIDNYTCDGAEYSGKMRLTLYRPQYDDVPATDDLPDDFGIGTRVSLFGSTYIAQGARGEGGFDYRAYLMRRGVYACGSGQLVGAQFEYTGELGLLDWFFMLKQHIIDTLDAELGEQSATARGIMLGDGASMPDELYDDYRNAGLSHILAVSGMHISAIILLLGFLLKLTPKWLRGAVTFFVLVLYCGITGFSVSVVRASIMGAVMLVISQTGMRYDGPSALSLAMIVILIATPGAAMDTGFAMTFGAVASIYSLYPGLRTRMPHVALKLKKKHGKSIKVILNAAIKFINLVGEWLINSLAISICVTVGLLPLTSAYFGRINIMGLFTSAAGIASGMGVLYAGWACALTHMWAPHLALLFGCAARLCAKAIESVATWTASVNFGIICMRAINSWWLLVLAPLMLWASRYRPMLGRWRAVCGTLACVLIVVLLLPPMPGDGLDYIMVDVGQGDGALFTDGAHAVVIDVGEEDSALSDYIRRRGLRVNALIISHLHTDHAGDLEEVISVSGVKTIYLPCNAEEGADEEVLEMLDRIKQTGVKCEYLSAGDVLEPLDGLTLSVLHPSAGSAFTDSNDYSLVLRAEYAGRSLLLTGDLTEDGEDFSVTDCDVLKVAHHGSASSSSLNMLASANARLALISVSSHNSYGLPKEELLKRLEYVGAQVLTTAECGDITVHIAPDGTMTAKTYLNAPDSTMEDT